MDADWIVKLAMPKWGLSMTEGRFVDWLVEEGAEVQQGSEVAEVETEKINGIVEAPASGTLRRRVAQPGQELPVGALLGVIADRSIPDADIDAFVVEFQATFVPEEAAEEAGPAPETVVLGGRTIRYVRFGEGDETLVLLHGFGGDLDNWLFNVEALARRRTLYTVDLPGHGGSSKDVGEGTLETFAAVLREFLDALGVRRVHLAGHSLGGAVAATFAADHPERVLSLTLIASAGFGEEIDGEYIDGFIGAQTRRELKPFLERLFADRGLVTRQLVDDVLRYKRLDGATEALRKVADAVFPGGKQRNRLGEIPSSIPTLVIWGADDRIIPSAHSAGVPSHARVEVIQGRGHSPHMEAAGDVNRLVEEFLEGAKAA